MEKERSMLERGLELKRKGKRNWHGDFLTIYASLALHGKKWQPSYEHIRPQDPSICRIPIKYLLMVTIGFLAIAGLDCRRNPVAPPPNGSDTTSHNWTFTIDTLGDGSGGSYLNDVAIVNTNPPIVYAVGQVYRMDSAGQSSPTLYNMAQWDGNGWRLESIPYHYQGQTYYHEWKAVFALAPNDVWLGGNGLLHWNGAAFSEVLQLNSVWGPHDIQKMWGTSDEDLYIVGENGSMAHFNGISWQSISTGTTEDIQDIWGGTDLITGKEFALV